MNRSLKTAGVAILGVGVGFAIGYKLTEKRLSKQYEDRMQEEEQLIKEFYSVTNNKKPYATPEEAAAALIAETDEETEEPKDPRVKHQRTQYNKIVKNERYDGDPLGEFEEGCEIDPVVHSNVFDEHLSDVPAIITQDQFMANETGYEQATLMFYAKGGVLTDQRDEIIDNPINVVGNLSTMNFGQDSSDPNTVHIRNDKLQMEFEVVKSERSYTEDVLGQDDAETPPHRRRRV